jgi:phosphoribosylglycinamide formyltransferase-1
MKTTNIAIFASGSGTNAENMIRYFGNHQHVKISLIVSNNPGAYVLERARRHNIPSELMDKAFRNSRERVMALLDDHSIEFIVLAGYMLLLPSWLVQRFPGRIVNIHPALLPAYGGKGMYGDHVHRAVIAAGETRSGITIHYVNERYDEGDIIFQAQCPVMKDDTPESLAARVHELEYEHYPRVVEEVIDRL